MMKKLPFILVAFTAVIGAGLPIYKWVAGRRSGDIPSEAEWSMLGETYTPWHSELSFWFFGQFVTLAIIMAISFLSEIFFRDTFKRVLVFGGVIWMALIIIGLFQYGWAIAD